MRVAFEATDTGMRFDTAGLRDTDDQVERIGVERALKAISEADRVLLVVDSTAPKPPIPLPCGRNSSNSARIRRGSP